MKDWCKLIATMREINFCQRLVLISIRLLCIPKIIRNDDREVKNMWKTAEMISAKIIIYLNVTKFKHPKGWKNQANQRCTESKKNAKNFDPGRKWNSHLKKLKRDAQFGTWSGGGAGTLGGAWHFEVALIKALGPRDSPELADAGCLRGLLHLLDAVGAVLVHGAHGAAGWCGLRLLAPSVDGLPFICFASPPAGVSRSRIWHHETRFFHFAHGAFSAYFVFSSRSL